MKSEPKIPSRDWEYDQGAVNLVKAVLYVGQCILHAAYLICKSINGIPK